MAALKIAAFSMPRTSRLPILRCSSPLLAYTLVGWLGAALDTKVEFALLAAIAGAAVLAAFRLVRSPGGGLTG